MGGGKTATPPRKVMVVADPSRESATALQYALSHAIIQDDKLILLHVGNPGSWRTAISTLLQRRSLPLPSMSRGPDGCSASGGGEDFDFLDAMKDACRVVQPNLRVHIKKVEIEEDNKAATILSQCKVYSVDLLIIGQRRSLSATLLGTRWNGGSRRGLRGVEPAEYLIEHSKCTCVAVQKKGQNAGYLLNTKSLKNFWLLA